MIYIYLELILRSSLLIETFAKHIFKLVDIILLTKTFLELKPVMISHSCLQIQLTFNHD